MTTDMTADGSVAHAPVRDIVDLARLAPSVHNTQPWRWKAIGNALELYADPRRRLAAADTRGRNLAISCGAALHHAQVAARALGWRPTVTRLPEGGGSTLLARIALSPATASPDAEEQLQAIRDRRTDRRRATTPVPEERMAALATTANSWGADTLRVLDRTNLGWAERLIDEALDDHAADERLSEEQLRWVDHSKRDGVPGAVIPAAPPPASSLRTRYASDLDPAIDPAIELEEADGLLVMRGRSDDLGAWLRTGEGLSAMWLRATRQGLSMVPLSQPIELDWTHEALRGAVLRDLGFPHLLVRVSQRAIHGGTLPRTPRRPLDDVMSM